MASRFFVAAKRDFLRRQSSSFMNYRSQLHIFNSTSSSINPPPLRHRLIDVEFMHQESRYREDKEREWERGRMDNINGGIAEVHELNYSSEANSELEKLIRRVEDAKAARNQCRANWKLGYEDPRQRVNQLHNELRKMDVSWAKLDEILLAGKETEPVSDESIDNGPGIAKGSSALAKHLDKPNQETKHLVEVIARTEEAMVIARPEEDEDFPEICRAYRKLKPNKKILVLILITYVGVWVFGPVFLLLVPFLPALLELSLSIPVEVILETILISSAAVIAGGLIITLVAVIMLLAWCLIARSNIIEETKPSDETAR